MAYFPGDGCSVWFEADKLVWNDKGVSRDIPWSEIRRVSTGEGGATLQLTEQTVTIPPTVVHFEFVVEDAELPTNPIPGDTSERMHTDPRELYDD